VLLYMFHNAILDISSAFNASRETETSGLWGPKEMFQLLKKSYILKINCVTFNFLWCLK
jgi:hypothetical protein